MKRLFYLGTDLDDVAAIVCEMEREGMTDRQYFVLSRDTYGLRRRFLHGDNTLENTRIVAAGTRSNIFAITAVIVFVISALLLVSLQNIVVPTLFTISLLVFTVVKFAVLVGGGMYDDYYKGVFNNKLDGGEIIIVVDCDQAQAKRVRRLFNDCSTTCLLVDASNFASPLPIKKYIKRDCLVQ